MATATMSPPFHGDQDKHLNTETDHPTSTGNDSFNPSAPASALTPPTSEDNDAKLETQSSSDLSDVEESKKEEEQEEEIVPDHYYDGGKIPVFKPVRHNVHVIWICAFHMSQKIHVGGFIY